MTFIDFFAGVGGFTKGMTRAGYKPVGWCEIDKFARKSYIAIHEPGDEWNATDIRLVQPGDLPEADCYCFGFPCQAFSIAGQRRGFEDTRGTLFFEVMRLARERKPKYLFAENVAGLLNHEGGRTFATILCSFWELGYEWQYQVLNSKDFGVPQNRERVFIIGHLRGEPRPEVFPIFGTDRETIETDCELSFLNRPEFGKVKQSSVCQTIKATNQKYPVMCIQKTHGKNTSVNYDETGTLQAARLDKVPCIPVLIPDREEKRQNGRRFKEPGDPMFTLTAQDIHGIAMIDYRNNRVMEVCPTLLGNDHNTIHRVMIQEPSGIYTQVSDDFLRQPLEGISRSLKANKHDAGIIDSQFRIRKLTPLEYWRLQGWDDEDFYKARAVNSDSQLYKQAGNGVTVNVIEAIANRLLKVA